MEGSRLRRVRDVMTFLDIPHARFAGAPFAKGDLFVRYALLVYTSNGRHDIASAFPLSFGMIAKNPYVGCSYWSP
jgi:hypothetical protein